MFSYTQPVYFFIFWEIFVTFTTTLGVIHKVRAQIGGRGVMAKAYGCVQGEGVKYIEYVRISAVYFPFLKIFSTKKEKRQRLR